MEDPQQKLDMKILFSKSLVHNTSRKMEYSPILGQYSISIPTENVNDVNDIVLVFLLLTFNIFHTFF